MEYGFSNFERFYIASGCELRGRSFTDMGVFKGVEHDGGYERVLFGEELARNGFFRDLE